MEYLELHDKLKIEKSLSFKIMKIMNSKGYRYDFSNNTFHKYGISAYLYYNSLIFFFDIPISKSGFNPNHKLKIL